MDSWWSSTRKTRHTRRSGYQDGVHDPHIYFYVDVKGKDGKVTNWALEGGPPNVLYRQGWRKDTVKREIVTVKGYRAETAQFGSC